MSKWIGYAVSANCGEPLGCYQGTILEADGTTLTLTKPFRNGFPYPKSQVTLNACDIKELRIIEAAAAAAQAPPPSTVAVGKARGKAARATVCEALQANPSSSGNQASSSSTRASGAAGAGAGGGGTPAARSKPIDIQPARANKNNAHSGSYGTSGSTPKARGGGGGGAGGGHDRARRRNEAFLGNAADPALEHDFDFEGNLALFDKRALWQEMSARPDVVRAADRALRQGNYRHDQSVLGAAAPERGPRRHIWVPAEWRAAPGRDYVTDDGACVPAASDALRERLWGALHRCGLASSCLTLLARGAADVALRLVGGGRRLDASNAHQAPCAVALLAPGRAGAAALCAARLLASHGVRVALHVVPGVPHAATQHELDALALSDIAPAPLAQLPSADVVLLALPGADGEAECGAALHWARGARGAVVAVEPSATAEAAGVTARASVVSLLPPALPAALGRVYLCDVAPPLQLLAALGLRYQPPFGAAPVIALYSDEPEQ